MNPITRKETFLAAAGGQDVTTPTPITREEVFLDEIAKRGGGSSLPSTETASAGDVLSLDDNKEPQWAAPSGGGGGVLVVNMVYDEVKGNDYTDKTWKEIHDAPMAVIVTDSSMPGGITMKSISPVVLAEHSNSEYKVSYYFCTPIGGIDVGNLVTDSENGYLTYAE